MRKRYENCKISWFHVDLKMKALNWATISGFASTSTAVQWQSWRRLFRERNCRNEATPFRSRSTLRFRIFYAFLLCLLWSRDFQIGSPGIIRCSLSFFFHSADSLCLHRFWCRFSFWKTLCVCVGWLGFMKLVGKMWYCVIEWARFDNAFSARVLVTVFMSFGMVNENWSKLLNGEMQ